MGVLTLRYLLLILLAYLPANAGLAAGESEILMGYVITAKGITFQVASNGCTQAKDFTFVRLIGDPVGVELIRNIPDLCERNVPQGTQLSFTFAEMNLKPSNRFTVANKLMPVHTVPGK